MPDADRPVFALFRRPVFLLPVALVIFSVNLILRVQSLQGSNGRARDAAVSREIIKDAAGLLTAQIDAETSQRGFLLTGQQAYLEPFSGAQRQALENLAALEFSTRAFAG